MRATHTDDFSTTAEVLAPWLAKRGVLRMLPCAVCRNTGILNARELDMPTRYCDACPRGERTRARDERERAEVAAALRADRATAMERKLILPDTHAAFTLDTHPLRADPHGHASYTAVMDWFAAWDMRRGLVLTGDFGVGKTGLIVGMLQRLRARAVDEAWGIRFITSQRLMLKLQDGFHDDSYHRTLDEYSQVHLLALDDLCAEGATDWQQKQFLAILGERYNRNLPLMATTNRSMPELREMLTQRVYDRLREKCDFIAVRGRNLRS